MVSEPLRTVIVGVGHPDRGDDAAGRAVAKRLSGQVPAGVAVVMESGEATALLDRLAGADHAILIDAAVSGATPGTVHRFDVPAGQSPPSRSGMSTHGFGLAEALELAATLGRLPERCIVYAIEAASFEHGATLSPAVAAAVDTVAERILGELRDA